MPHLEIITPEGNVVHIDGEAIPQPNLQILTPDGNTVAINGRVVLPDHPVVEVDGLRGGKTLTDSEKLVAAVSLRKINRLKSAPQWLIDVLVMEGFTSKQQVQRIDAKQLKAILTKHCNAGEVNIAKQYIGKVTPSDTTIDQSLLVSWYKDKFGLDSEMLSSYTSAISSNY